MSKRVFKKTRWLTSLQQVWKSLIKSLSVFKLSGRVSILKESWLNLELSTCTRNQEMSGKVKKKKKA